MSKQDQKLDLAARAAWLYYVAGNTQEEIAVKLNVSRPGAQRLIALAMDEGLVKVRISHPIATCMVLAEQLRKRFNLDYCEVVPSDPGAAPDAVRHLAVAGAAYLEQCLSQRPPGVIALSTGRTLRAAVEEMAKISCPQHQFVSLVGNVARDGSANPYDAVMRLADKTGGRRFLLPAPLVADSVDDRDQLLHQRLYRAVMEVAATAEVVVVGIGNIAYNAPLHKDGFITDAEVEELLALGAVGEILGWTFDQVGQLVPSSVNERITSLSLPRPPTKPVIAMAGGIVKANAILAALRGQWITGLITDEAATAAIVKAA